MAVDRIVERTYYYYNDMKAQDEGDIQDLMATALELAKGYEPGLVYIDGIAVYLHMVNSSARRYAAFTHDGDFYISLSDMVDLRDIEHVTANRRLSKHQLIKNDYEFDIYTEGYSKLIVPYESIAALAVVVGGMRVACLEHLLVLKLEAYRDRRRSPKGEKDARDIARIAIGLATRSEIGDPFDSDRVLPYLREDHLSLLHEVWNSDAAMKICQGNAHDASHVRAAIGEVLRVLKVTMSESSDGEGPGPA